MLIFPEYANTFINFDKNRDGRLSSEELQTLLNSIGRKQSKAEVMAILKRADKDSMFKRVKQYLNKISVNLFKMILKKIWTELHKPKLSLSVI